MLSHGAPQTRLVLCLSTHVLERMIMSKNETDGFLNGNFSFNNKLPYKSFIFSTNRC